MFKATILVCQLQYSNGPEQTTVYAVEHASCPNRMQSWLHQLSGHLQTNISITGVHVTLKHLPGNFSTAATTSIYGQLGHVPVSLSIPWDRQLWRWSTGPLKPNISLDLLWEVLTDPLVSNCHFALIPSATTGTTHLHALEYQRIVSAAVI